MCIGCVLVHSEFIISFRSFFGSLYRVACNASQAHDWHNCIFFFLCGSCSDAFVSNFIKNSTTNIHLSSSMCISFKRDVLLCCPLEYLRISWVFVKQSFVSYFPFPFVYLPAFMFYALFLVFFPFSLSHWRWRRNEICVRMLRSIVAQREEEKNENEMNARNRKCFRVRLVSAANRKPENPKI